MLLRAAKYVAALFILHLDAVAIQISYIYIQLLLIAAKYKAAYVILYLNAAAILSS